MRTSILLIGPPGCGKGTQASLLEEKFRHVSVTMSDLLREEVQKETPLGQQLNEMISKGLLADTALVTEILKKKIQSLDEKVFLVLDGYPRSLEQKKALQTLDSDLKILKVIYLKVPIENLVERVKNRAKLEGRVDDEESVFRTRLEVFYFETLPVIQAFQEEGLLFEVNASASVDQVFQKIVKLLPQ